MYIIVFNSNFSVVMTLDYNNKCNYNIVVCDYTYEVRDHPAR